MCGIAGLLTSPTYETSKGVRLVSTMTLALAHRGPDGSGLYRDGQELGQKAFLGHRRLSIIDPTEAGAQPMTDPSGRFTLVFNGAIYNFVELLKELLAIHGNLPLRGHSDTEVLLHAWATFGPGCLPKLNGMFAFALWDKKEKTLFLCRDRFGVKPLFYSWLGQSPDGVRLLFASEAKALFVHPALRPNPDRLLLAEFLENHTIDHYPERTLFEGIAQVPPASYLAIAPGPSLPTQHCYYEIRKTPEKERRALGPELVEETRSLLMDATAIRLRSDVPLGGTLSGGLDSSLLSGIVAGPLAQKGLVSSPYRLFLSQFPGTMEDKKGDESPWAEKMLAFLPASVVLPLRSSPGATELRADLEDVLFHQEEPFSDSSICAHYALMRRVNQAGVKVVLTGQGADEIFGGYVSYYYALLGDLLRSGNVGKMVHHAQRRSQVFSERLSRLLIGGLYHALPDPLRQLLHERRQHQVYPLTEGARSLLGAKAPRYGSQSEGAALRKRFDTLDAYLLDCIARYALPHILRQDDRNAMAFGIESRAPYLDYRLANLAFSTTQEARIGDGYTKRLLREVARGLMPEEVRLRPDKMGFWSPQRQWLKESEDYVRSVADPLPDVLGDLTDVSSFRQMLDAFYAGRGDAKTEQIWTGFLSSLWIRRTLPRMARVAI